MVKCDFCNNTNRIESWKEYMEAWRCARAKKGNEWMLKVTVNELLQTLRTIRDGWTSSVTGNINHYEDCPNCLGGR